MELLKKFKEEFANFEKERQELANAEKLFGLSITLYPELLEMEKELRGLDQIFSIYENQKVRKFISQWRGGSVAERLERWTSNSQAQISSQALTASWICSWWSQI